MTIILFLSFKYNRLTFTLFIMVIVIATIADVYKVGQQSQSFDTIDTILNEASTRKEVSKGNCTLIQFNIEDLLINFFPWSGLPLQDVYWFTTNGIGGARKEVPLSEVSSQVSRSSASSIDQDKTSANSYWIKVLLCFSAKRSASLILKLDDEPTLRTPAPCLPSHSSPPSVTSKDSTTTPPRSLGVIHGLRVVTMAWIILGHTYGLVNPQIHSELLCTFNLHLHLNPVWCTGFNGLL